MSENQSDPSVIDGSGKRPDLNLYFIENMPDGTTFHRKVGAIWRHGKGGGEKVVVSPFRGLNIRLVAFPPKER